MRVWRRRFCGEGVGGLATPPFFLHPVGEGILEGEEYMRDDGMMVHRRRLLSCCLGTDIWYVSVFSIG